MDSAVRRIRSHETLNTNDSLKLGSVVFCFVCVFCFSIFLPSHSNQSFTYGSEKHKTVSGSWICYIYHYFEKVKVFPYSMWAFIKASADSGL